MIHSGSASGGHYYAYIKDFKHGEWFCFNDQSVSRVGFIYFKELCFKFYFQITHEDIKRSFGGSRGYYSGVYSPSTNAYMLMYRQINTRNATPMTTEEFPPHIHQLLKRIKEQKVLIFFIVGSIHKVFSCFFLENNFPIKKTFFKVNLFLFCRKRSFEFVKKNRK